MAGVGNDRDDAAGSNQLYCRVKAFESRVGPGDDGFVISGQVTKIKHHGVHRGLGVVSKMIHNGFVACMQ